MKKPASFRAALLLALWLVFARPAAASEAVTLVYRAPAGHREMLTSASRLLIEAGGHKATLETSRTEQITVSAVAAATGNLTLVRQITASALVVDGEKQADNEKSSPDTLTITPRGDLVAFRNGEDASPLAVRLTIATLPVFPAGPVQIGDTWTRTHAADETLGRRAARADFELLDFETVHGVVCAKLAMRYAETAPGGLCGRGTVWVEKARGHKVRLDYAVENVPFGPESLGARASGTLREERGSTPVLRGENALNTIDAFVAGCEKLPGLITLFRKKENNRNTIYAEIREDQLGQRMMLETTASTGTADQIAAGDPINDLVFTLTRSADDKIYLCAPNHGFRAQGREMKRAVERSFADAYLLAFTIEARQPDRRSLLIDVSDLFRGDLAQLSRSFASSGMTLDREKTFVTAISNFSDNLVVTAQYHFVRAASSRPLGNGTLADERSAPLLVCYNLFALPANTGYTPRVADGRVGYFTTAFQNFDDDHAGDPTVRYLLRWDLRKKNPSARLSEPVTPIVFWMDNAIPLPYRSAVRDGLLMWNKAFETIGLKSVIVVKQRPDDANPNDHADMRFNTIRWVVSPGAGYAVAQIRVDPASGQILNANISVDANLLRFFKRERALFIDPARAFAAGAGGVSVAEQGNNNDVRRCRIGPERREQSWWGYAALSLGGGAAGEAVDADARRRVYAQQLVREIVGHEMGHVLGLRHNFIASTALSLAELANPTRVQAEGLGASVMDYNPFNLAALKNKNVPFFSPTIGVYDKWAIRYGYTIVGAKAPGAERQALAEIARQSNAPGHAFQSDEMAWAGFDPLVARYDLGGDPLAYWTRMLQTTRHLLVHLDERLPRNGESFHEFTQAFGGLLSAYAHAAGAASRYVGGVHVNRNHKGDPGEKPALVPIKAAKQKEALALLDTFLFAPTALRFPARFYAKLASDPFGFAPGPFPAADHLSGLQRAALRQLFAPAVLSRVAGNEFQGGDTLTLPALFERVRTGVWAELGTKANVGALRRRLQRAHVDALVDLARNSSSNNAPPDAKMLAWDQLKQLRTRLAAAKTAKNDAYTRLHWEDLLATVSRALAAR